LFILYVCLSTNSSIFIRLDLFSTIKAHNQELFEDPIHSRIRWRNWINVKRFIVVIHDTTALAGSLVAVENRQSLLSKIEIVAVVFQSREQPSLAQIAAD
jgi:hypothetical protein